MTEKLYTAAERQDAYNRGWADARAVHGDGLDAAWAEAEAALPGRLVLTLVGWSSGSASAWTEDYDAEDEDPIHGPFVATTPALALRALARALRGDNPCHIQPAVSHEAPTTGQANRGDNP